MTGGSAWYRAWAAGRLRLHKWFIWSLAASLAACAAGLLAVAVLVGPRGREYLSNYAWACFWSSGGIISDASTYVVDGQAYRMPDAQAFEWFRTTVYHERSCAGLFTWFTWTGFLGGFLPTLGWLWWRFRQPHPTEGEGRTLRGTAVQDAATFTRRALAAAGGEAGLGLALGDARIPRSQETLHILTGGSTRSGKTTLIRQILRQLAERGATAIVYDPEAELLPEFFDASRGDLILNPTDARTPTWAMAEEASGPAELPMLASALITAGRDLLPVDEFWLRSARQVFVDLVPHVGADPLRLAELLSQPAEQIVPLVAGTMSAALLNPRAAGQMSGILATLAIPSAPLRLLSADQPTTWSARRWVETRRGWVWLTTTQVHRESAIILTSAWLTLLAHRLLDESLATAAERECWIVADEVHTLRRLEALEPLLVQGAKRGVRLVIGTQTMSQLRERYGPHTSVTLLAQPGTAVLLRSQDVETSKWAADRLGTREREIAADSMSVGLLRIRDAFQARDQRATDHAVLPSEIADLPNLKGFIAAAALGIAELTLTYTPPGPARTPAYVPQTPTAPEPPETPEAPEPPAPEGVW